MAKNFKEWIQEGESLYEQAVKDFQSIEAQIEELEARMNGKKDEANQLASVIGRPPVESKRHPAPVQIVEAHTPGNIPASRNNIVKALAGRGLG